MFLGKIVLKISSKFTGEHQCQSVISMKLQSNFIETTLRHGCSNLLHIFRTPFSKDTSGGMLLSLHKNTLAKSKSKLPNKFTEYVQSYQEKHQIDISLHRPSFFIVNFSNTISTNLVFRC